MSAKEIWSEAWRWALLPVTLMAAVILLIDAVIDTLVGWVIDP